MDEQISGQMNKWTNGQMDELMIFNEEKMRGFMTCG
jgi:hypothetical protein